MKAYSKNGPNWLLISLIAVSIGLHIIIFAHISGIYRFKELSYIELSLKDLLIPDTRSIPRPSKRAPNAISPSILEGRQIESIPIPTLTPEMPQASQNAPLFRPIQDINPPEGINRSKINIHEWSNKSTKGNLVKDHLEDNGSEQYFALVRFRIERQKRYPIRAKRRQLEGKARLSFVIHADGGITDLKISETSHYRLLDRAALEAVKEAVPFPRPPERVFKGSVRIEIDIVFTLS